VTSDNETILQDELRVFDQHKRQWLRTNSGEFVVIAGTTVAGFYPDYESAFHAGIKKFGVTTEFLVKQVCAEEPVYLIYWDPIVKWPRSPATLLQEGPYIPILISATRLEVEEGRKIGLDFPEWSINALIDTGASVTVINPEVAKTCKLRWTGRARIIAVGGMAGEFPEHAAAISFPGTELSSFSAIRVVACPIIRRTFSCLIGRDILQKWLFLYDGRGGQIEIQS
jgi:predicted aspartyl protease